MRMSERKSLLRAVELVAAADVLAALAIIGLVIDRYISPATAQPYVLSGFLLLFPVWSVAVFLMVEFTKLRREGQSWWARSKGLSFEEMKALVQWCPRPFQYAALVITVLAMLVMLKTGGTHWSSGQDFTERHAIGFSLAILLFCSLAYPVLASASRMPGQFADHFTATNAHLTRRST